MDEIIIFVIIWIIITVINLLSKQAKKKKEQEKPSPEPQTVQKPDELPPFLKNILGIPEEKPVTQTSTVLEDEEETELFEEPETTTDTVEEQFLEDDDKEHAEFTQPEESLDQPIETKHEIQKEIKPIRKVQKGKKKLILESGSLKKAIILKEILDKPTSLRNFKNNKRYQT